ncbi:Benzoate 1,2-dioxygenase electron transfer component [Raoultella terrigena]|uniref:Benzoate 1,2-dioxygenase electron transfer component n=1 Tax=Raoultella terrigena TaxID=577 RepID=A0A485BET9_RAOTE|nr:Benzoate 1,2-dioxygenase electron transfer component [Raoultella terrigena]
MSQWLTQRARPGERLILSGPMGSFYLRGGERPLLMLAGGTGLAPLLSMLHTLVQQGSTRPVTLVYGVTAIAIWSKPRRWTPSSASSPATAGCRWWPTRKAAVRSVGLSPTISMSPCLTAGMLISTSAVRRRWLTRFPPRFATAALSPPVFGMKNLSPARARRHKERACDSG